MSVARHLEIEIQVMDFYLLTSVTIKDPCDYLTVRPRNAMLCITLLLCVLEGRCDI